jgi:hypothetical protein
MSEKVFGFKNQLNVGDRGEKDFVESYKEFSPEKSKDRAIDFHLNTGESVELKTDTYPMEKTLNFFMETLGNVNAGKLGGPFRARQDGVKYFIYYYLNDKQFFWFETVKLCEKLEEIISTKKHKIKSIKNKTWITHGYAIPRSELESVLHRHDIFP